MRQKEKLLCPNDDDQDGDCPICVRAPKGCYWKERIASMAVAKMLDDLEGRKGIGNELLLIEPDTKKELTDSLESAVRQVL